MTFRMLHLCSLGLYRSSAIFLRRRCPWISCRWSRPSIDTLPGILTSGFVLKISFHDNPYYLTAVRRLTRSLRGVRECAWLSVHPIRVRQVTMKIRIEARHDWVLLILKDSAFKISLLCVLTPQSGSLSRVPCFPSLRWLSEPRLCRKFLSRSLVNTFIDQSPPRSESSTPEQDSSVDVTVM
ncbi:hypothetical protein B0H14DRAFT_1648628 [Mycena olivaceomarginata]|nr:hypothetical protein B0H14DRAFT_1648628 [Mycena olivaceomarginata]